jgi:hypothetical protein
LESGSAWAPQLRLDVEAHVTLVQVESAGILPGALAVVICMGRQSFKSRILKEEFGSMRLGNCHQRPEFDTPDDEQAHAKSVAPAQH